MADHPLDNPIWTSLAIAHAALAIGGDHARRYPSEIGPLAGSRDITKESHIALRDCIRSGGPAVVAHAVDFDVPPGTKALWGRDAAQMVLEDEMPETADDPRIEPLSAADAADMLALAQLTKPGPFSIRTYELGQYWGIKREGHLIAMAGERMRQAGFAEISAVCTHPDHRRKGLGRVLSAKVCRTILDRAETPYLHAFLDNPPARQLYESLGFRTRQTIRVLGLEAI